MKKKRLNKILSSPPSALYHQLDHSQINTMILSLTAKSFGPALIQPSKGLFVSFLRYNSTQSPAATTQTPAPATPAAAPSKPTFVSIAPAGTKMKGLNILKGQDTVVALADEEYPAWLWQVLDKEAQKKKLEADPMKAAQKARRNANRKKIKEHNFLTAMSK